MITELHRHDDDNTLPIACMINSNSDYLISFNHTSFQLGQILSRLANSLQCTIEITEKTDNPDEKLHTIYTGELNDLIAYYDISDIIYRDVIAITVDNDQGYCTISICLCPEDDN